MTNINLRKYISTVYSQMTSEVNKLILVDSKTLKRLEIKNNIFAEKEVKTKGNMKIKIKFILPLICV